MARSRAAITRLVAAGDEHVEHLSLARGEHVESAGWLLLAQRDTVPERETCRPVRAGAIGPAVAGGASRYTPTRWPATVSDDYPPTGMGGESS